MRINHKKISIKRKKSTIIILIFLFIIIPISYILIYNIVTKPSGTENITTKLNTETDFLNWFIDFDNLYNKKIKSPKYSLTKNSFEKINNLLNNTNEENNIYLKNNIYYIDNTTLELDVNTRSLRYTKYNDDDIIEILEIRLLNGKYYVQLINEKYLYKISFNKNKVSEKKYKNKENKISIKDSIYKNKDFNW